MSSIQTAQHGGGLIRVVSKTHRIKGITSLDIVEDWDTVLRRASISAVLEARIAVEAEAAALAAQRRTPAQLRFMRQTLNARATIHDGIEMHVDADVAFYRSIVAASSDHDVHAALVEVIAAKDAARAAETSRAYLTSLKETLA